MTETTWTFEQDVSTDCSNSCIARYLSIISRVAQSSAVPFRERSRVRAGNYAVDAVDVDVVFSHTPLNHYCIVYRCCCFHDCADDETLLVKLLIPSASAGIILGKGGETIICLQSQYCTNIKLSKAGDFFPGLLMLFYEKFGCTF